MRKQILSPMHLDRLPVMPVVYVPQNLRTIALQCLNETIGAMSIEFGVEIETQNSNYKWLSVLLQRSNEQGDKGAVNRTIRLGDFLVVLENEIHVFPGEVFWDTFAPADHVPAHAEPAQEQFLGIVTKAELRADEKSSIFMDLPPDLTYEGKLPDVPQIN